MIIRTLPNARKFDELPLALTIEMSVGDWLKIYETLKTANDYASCDLRRDVMGALDKLKTNLGVYHPGGSE